LISAYASCKACSTTTTAAIRKSTSPTPAWRASLPTGWLFQAVPSAPTPCGQMQQNLDFVSLALPGEPLLRVQDPHESIRVPVASVEPDNNRERTADGDHVEPVHRDGERDPAHVLDVRPRFPRKQVGDPHRRTTSAT
jgi:hypothetical protein